MTNLLTAIQQYLTENPIADESQRNWESVAAAMRAITETTSNIHVSGKATIVGLDMQGIDSDSIRTVLESSPSGRGVLGLLDSGQLVDWVDPVTVAALAKNTGDGMLSTEDVEALKSLSVSVTNPFESETAESCQRAWLVRGTLNEIEAAQAAAGTRLNNATASLGAEHIDGLTLEQLQARCDAVAASADGLVGE
jgi:hypothetical protein